MKKLGIKAWDLVYILVSALFYSVAIKWFVEPNHLLPAGFSGFSQLIALLLSKYLDIQIHFMLLYLVLQVVTSALVFRFIGKRFAALSILQFTLSTLFSQLLPPLSVGEDALLLTIFGGVICGFSTVLALKAGASTGGTDFIAVYLLNRKNMPVFNYIMYGNFVILALSGVLVQWELALYSMVFQFATTMIINHVSDVNVLKQLLIVTTRGDEVAAALHTVTRHGITRLQSYGTYSRMDNNLLFMVVNEYEVGALVQRILQIDKDAFISVNRCDKVVGKFSIKKIL